MKKVLSTFAMLLCFAMATNAQTINETLTAVGAPERLEATEVNDTTVLLAWTPVAGSLGYGIMVYGEPLGLVSNADTSAYATVVPEVEYCFTIVSILQIDDLNYPTEWSEPSEAACITTGSDELALEELASSFSVYPNPVGSELFLATELRVEEVSIYDIYGRQTTVCGLQTTDFVHSINVSELNSGIYFVNIKTENGNVVKRFVKK